MFVKNANKTLQQTTKRGVYICVRKNTPPSWLQLSFAFGKGNNMSELERTVQTGLEQQNIAFVPQEKIPVETWPWKRPRSHKPKCDFFLPVGDIYVEVKGFMTIHTMAKMFWFARQSNLNYYILQGTEKD